MRIQLEGKTFILELIEGSLMVKEISLGGEWWIKFPCWLLSWVSGILRCCSDLVEFDYRRKCGFLAWKIQSGLNSKGWFLKLSVVIRGSEFSVMVPSQSSHEPWKFFCDSFLQVAGIAVEPPCVVHHSHSSIRDLSDPLAIPNSGIVVDNRVLKEGVDALLLLECSKFASSSCCPEVFSSFSHGSCGFGCIDKVEESVICGEPDDCGFSNDGDFAYEEPLKDLSLNAADAIMVSVAVIEELSREAEEIRSMSCGGGSVSIVDEYCGLNFLDESVLSGKKKKQRNIAVVTFPSEPISKSSAVSIASNESGGNSSLTSGMSFNPLPKPSMAIRSSSRGSSSISSWDRLPKGVNHHPISKYSEYKRLDPDRAWVLEALELSDDATKEDVFKRMYEFQRLGKIDISKKVIRILEGISKEGRSKAS